MVRGGPIRLLRVFDSLSSAIRTTAGLLGAALALVVIYSTLSPLEMRPVLTADADIERFLAFASLAGCFVFAAPRRWPLILALTLMFGAGLEIAQTLRPDRHGLWHDFDWKAAGACFGAMLALAGHRLLQTLASSLRPGA